MKKGYVVILQTLTLSLILTTFASSYTYGYGGGLGDVLNQFDSSTVFLATMFIIFYALISLGLTRFFGKENRSTVVVIAFATSLLLIYAMNASGINFNNLFYDLGYSVGLPIDLIYSILPFVVIGGFIFFGIRSGWGPALLGLGAVLIIASFFAFEKGLLLTVGIIAVLAGAIMSAKKKENGFSIKLGS